MIYRKLRLFIYAVLSLGIMCLIFILSSQPAGLSQQLSDGLLMKMILFFGVEDTSCVAEFGKLIRKAAHFAEYAVLAICLGLFFTEYAGRRLELRKYFPAFFTSAVYAVSDEVHQYFVPGRSMQLSDVLLDCSGAAVGLVCLYILFKLTISHREERKTVEQASSPKKE